MQKTAHRILFFITLALLLGQPVHAGKLYKWVDETGHVHYSQTPPTRGNATEVQIPKSALTPATADNTAAEPGQAEAAAADPLEQMREARLKNCEIARQNLSTYQTSQQIQQADGTVITLDDATRAAKIAEAQAYIAEFCN